MSTEIILTETVKELSYSTARSNGSGNDLPDDTDGFTNIDGAGDGHGGLIKAYKDTTEVTSTNRDSQERFVSIIEKRKLERRFEEEMEIKWETSERVDEENMASKVDNLLSKLKSRFSEEKEARKYAVKQNRSYYNFCNSVDAFLRHVEKPKVDIKYSERDDVLQGEGVYSFGIRPAAINRRNVKASSFESTKIDGVSYTDAVKETTSIEEEVEKSIDESGNGKGIHELCKVAKESHVASTGNSLPLDKAVKLPATLPSIYQSRNDHANAAPIADDNLLLQATDDSGRNISFATMGNYYGLLRSKELKPFVCANFTSAKPFPRAVGPGYMPMIVKEKYLPEMYLRGQYTRTSIYTNTTRLQFRRIISVLNRKCLMYKINMSVPSKHLNKRVNGEQFLMCIKSKQNVNGFLADDIIYPKYALPVWFTSVWFTSGVWFYDIQNCFWNYFRCNNRIFKNRTRLRLKHLH
ncbi:uncharacterized protein LOC132735659 [Ruditapes philippinarum]|uniref:uncharacterized protein LOC132735659 n=1 Tax=Ruditapes philippinarum TaxID=129788 RepID=UPI00295A7ED3|nr:uncharacterized protein LOC132735659 [Ruditapes philippinarum]